MGAANIFVDELTRFAQAADPPVPAIARRAAAPLRVAVCGRPGVGRRTVCRALGGAGVSLATAGVEHADVVVQVIAEVIKPEDTAAIASRSQPVLVVLNKADLLPAASAPSARLAALARVPVRPMVGLLAVAALDGVLDERLEAGLRVLAGEPADLGCAERFLAGPHRLSRRQRLRLLDTLGLFGIGCAVVAIQQGHTGGQLRAVLRDASGVDAVRAQLDALGAEMAYRRMCDAVAELEAAALADEAIGAFLRRDDTVLAGTATAAAVLAAAGLDVAVDEDPAALLRSAAAWQAYRRGPVSEVHRGCAGELARGALRRWARAGGAR